MFSIFDQVVIHQGSGGYYQDFFCIGANIRIGQDMLCHPYAENFYMKTFPLRFFLS